MNLNKLKPVENVLFVDIITPTQEEVDNYYVNTGEMKSSSSSENAPRIFKKAVITNTFDEEKIPVGSSWMMGESPGMKINFFGKKIIAIQEKDLYARID